jgi:hypothetical protein
METIFIIVVFTILIFVAGRVLEDKLTKLEERLNNIENKLDKKSEFPRKTLS